jgi:tRNA threonylcarbamoyladenosine biosynthesis protein TsaB
MIWLGIDTTTSWFSAALSAGEDLIVEHITLLKRSMLKRGDEMLRHLFRDTGLEFNDIRGIAVGTGPGSYTGLRVGMGLAQGLQLSLNIPFVGVKTSMVLASYMPGYRRIIVAQDAGRRTGHIVLSLYNGNEFPPEEIRPPTIVQPHEVASWYTPGDALVGGAAERFVEMLEDSIKTKCSLSVSTQSIPRASVIIRIGRRFHESGSGEDAAIPAGIYLTEPPKPATA